MAGPVAAIAAAIASRFRLPVSPTARCRQGLPCWHSFGIGFPSGSGLLLHVYLLIHCQQHSLIRRTIPGAIPTIPARRPAVL